MLRVIGKAFVSLLKLIVTYWVGLVLFLVAFSMFGTSAYYFEESGQEFIIAAFMQGAAVFLALSLAFFFFELGTQRRQRGIDKVLGISLKDLRREAAAAVVSATTAVWNKPKSYGLIPEPEEYSAVYEDSKKLVLDRSYQSRDYPNDVLERGTFYWASRAFQNLAFECDQIIRTLGPSLTGYGALLGAMRALEDKVISEKKVWDEYLIISAKQKDFRIPVDAGYDLIVLAASTLDPILVLDSDNYEGSANARSPDEIYYDQFHRSGEWGFWRLEDYEEDTFTD